MSDFNRYETGQTIVGRVLRAMNLPVPASVAGSTEGIPVQMWELLTACGRELMENAHQWQIKNKTYTFTTTAALTYAVPSDLVYFKDNTGWNLTARIPLIGPMTDQQWALLVARQLGGTTLYLQFRVADDNIEFYFVPSDPQNVSIEYNGRGWVQDESDPLVFRDFVENDGDLILFPPLLMFKMLKLKWRDAKGFDTTKEQYDFDNFLNTVIGNDKPNPDLSIARVNRYPYLGLFNLPDTGYGSSS